MLNPNEAPSGMIAEPFMGCRYCALAQNVNKCNAANCFASERQDKTMVHFKLKQPDPGLLNEAPRCRLHTDSGHSYGPVAGCHECAAESSGLRNPAVTKASPDLLNAATHEQRKQTVTISAELSDAYVTLLRAAEKMSEISHDEEDSTFGDAYDDVIEAMEQVLRAGGGAK